jgi:hypothetical protein
MTETRRNGCSRVRMLLLSLFTLVGASEAAFAVPQCAAAGANGKFWEYREVLITRNNKGLAKGNNMVNGDGVNAALNRLLRKKASWSTEQHIENIETLIPKLNSFEGAPGIVGYVWLEIAKKALAHYSTDTLDNFDKIGINVYGRIDNKNVEPHTTEDGYSYDKNNGSGHIWTTLCFEIRWDTNPTLPPDAKVQYSVKTAVAECGFRAIPRGPGTGNDPIFVGSYMTFLNSNPDLSGYQTKLEAINFLQGDTPKDYTCPAAPPNGYVTLGGVFFDKGDGTGFHNFGLGNHVFLFKANSEACVDMFFQTTAPPDGLVDGIHDRPNYCMGRCSDPPAVNSGA